MERAGTKSFLKTAGASQGEAVVFGWIVFDSRESRDLVNRKVEADPRMPQLVAPIMDPAAKVFDPQRMAYAGFEKLVQSSDSQ